MSFLAIPCFPIAKTQISTPLCSCPYRIVTNLQLLISTETFAHGEKSVHCLYETDFVKVSGDFYGVGFLGNRQQGIVISTKSSDQFIRLVRVVATAYGEIFFFGSVRFYFSVCMYRCHDKQTSKENTCFAKKCGASYDWPWPLEHSRIFRPR